LLTRPEKSGVSKAFCSRGMGALSVIQIEFGSFGSKTKPTMPRRSPPPGYSKCA
jgi:hypothetical protein